MIGIIDYGMGNLRSVQKGVQKVGAHAVVSKNPGELKGADKIILPGVGAFSDGIEQLKKNRWDSFITKFIAGGKPFLGICLGLQLLFESSQEGAGDIDNPVKGLGILPGRIVRFDEKNNLKIPHMGWNNITWDRNDPLLKSIAQNSQLYFVHSYYVLTDETNCAITSASSDYGGKFTASIWHNNIWATQFHPEKSQRIGLAILKNFVEL